MDNDAKLNLQLRIQAMKKALDIPHLPPVVLGFSAALLAARCLTETGGLRSLARWIVEHEQSVTESFNDPELLAIVKDLDDDSFDRAALERDVSEQELNT
jgi:hypothetical protein